MMPHMPWKRRKRGSERSEYGVAWLLDENNPWPVRVLDVRGLTQTMLSLVSDYDAAANAISFGGDDGTSFLDLRPPNSRTFEAGLQYSVDRMLAEGVLFAPKTMEHKWAMFYHDNRVLFVRSWTRQLLVTASISATDGEIVVTDVVGCFLDPEEPPELTIAIFDFLVRTHVLREEHPAPVPTDLADANVDQIAMHCFSMFGNLASFATPDRFEAPMPTQPLRSYSLFHIAIARGDLDAAQVQLDAGVPIDLLAGDGLHALQWAGAQPGTDLFEWLLARGLDIDARSAQGATTLMNFAQLDPEHNDVERMTWLLDHGADPNASDERGFTALHRAAERGSEPAVRLLLERGANPGAVAHGGHTARSLAETQNHNTIATLLDTAHD